MDTSRESGAEPPEDNPEGSISQIQESRIGSGTLSPNAAQIETELNRMMRSPFRRMLADYLGFAPTTDALQKFANKSPDRWIQGAVMLAQLAGYSKEVHVVSETTVNVSVMSDADIQVRLNETRAKLALQAGNRTLPLPLHVSGDKCNSPIRSAVQPDEPTDVAYQDHPAVNKGLPD